ncbi:MAG TPA: methyltransferase domain-containing protein [Acidobacteriota bacterium]|nr:methyltransferase domain-containing protein [Acidobacteriota bacterium]
MNDWTLAWYDAVAESYDRLAVPYVFEQPAKDLVTILKLPRGARTLDAGAGTGVGALLASKSVGSEGLVVALDTSLGMLLCARKKGLPLLVIGGAPGLPFPDTVFDGVIANFVLSHISSYQAALSDMVRVLRPGGRLGITAWGSLQGEFRKLWQATAESFASRDQLDRGLRQVLPWEGWLSDKGHLEDAMRDSGLEDIEVYHRVYESRVTVDDYLSMREITFQAMIMKQLLGKDQWRSFQEEATKVFRSRSQGLIEDTRDAHLAIGIKPLQIPRRKAPG